MMRTAALAILASLCLAGCAADDEDDRSCPARNTLARVESIQGDSIQVRLLQSSQGSGPATVHAGEADFYYYAGSLDECYDSERELLAIGQEIEFFADLWMESYPPQTHVEAIIIRG